MRTSRDHVADLLRRGGVPTVSARLDLFEIKRPGPLALGKQKAVDALRAAIVEAVLTCADEVSVYYSEDPRPDVAGACRANGPSSWSVRSESVDRRALQRWLYFGDWLLAAPAVDWPEGALHACSLWRPEVAIPTLRDLGVTVAIHADTDDSLWRVWVAGDPQKASKQRDPHATHRLE